MDRRVSKKVRATIASFVLLSILGATTVASPNLPISREDSLPRSYCTVIPETNDCRLDCWPLDYMSVRAVGDGSTYQAFALCAEITVTSCPGNQWKANCDAQGYNLFAIGLLGRCLVDVEDSDTNWGIYATCCSAPRAEDLQSAECYPPKWKPKER